MADVVPLIIQSGLIRRMQSGDTISSTLAPGSGGTSSAPTVFEINLGPLVRYSGNFTVGLVDVNLTIGCTVSIAQAPGPYSGKGTRTDECEMDNIVATAACSVAGDLTVYWGVPLDNGPIKGQIKFQYTAYPLPP